MFSHIMVAFDGSEVAKNALQTAIEVTRAFHAKLFIVHVNVVATNLRVQAMNSAPLKAMLEESGQRILDEAEQLVQETGIDYETFMITAASAPKPLLDFVAEHRIDLIIMGSRGLGVVKQYFGSVSHSVLNMAKVPVMVIKSAD